MPIIVLTFKLALSVGVVDNFAFQSPPRNLLLPFNSQRRRVRRHGFRVTGSTRWSEAELSLFTKQTMRAKQGPGECEELIKLKADSRANLG